MESLGAAKAKIGGGGILPVAHLYCPNMGVPLPPHTHTHPGDGAGNIKGFSLY